MGLAGKTIIVVDEETGEESEVTFKDTALTRWTGGIYSACDAFGLSHDEAAAIVYYGLIAKDSGVRKPVAPYARSGFIGLLKRGWMRQTALVFRAVPNEDFTSILKAAEAAITFGESAGLA